MAGDFIKQARRYCGGSGVLLGLIAANILIFLLAWIFSSVFNKGGDGNITMPWLCVSSNPVTALSHPWTLLTYMVTQYDFIHLLFNVLWLFWFGTMIPFWVSEWRRFWLYVGGGLSGAFFYLAVNSLWQASALSGGFLCGASAAVLAVMTATALWNPDREVYLFLIGPVKFKWVALTFIILTFLGMNGGSGAAQSAHVGGVVFGALFVLLSKRKATSRKVSGASSAASVKRTKVRLKVHRDGNAVAQAAAERLSDTGRLDQLLDKIRMSGYSSLSAGERNELIILSQRLDKK